MLSINTNLSSIVAQNSMKTSTDKLNQAIERMSTGCKINHAKDNAANYSISTNMTTKIGAYQVAEDNALQGLDMINTASESLTLIEDKLMRLRALAEQSANGTYGAQSKQAINQEANAIVDEIERLYNTTEYNGINLAKGKVIGTEESKFIKDIDRRDTSKMTTLASVAIDEALTSGTYSISTADELAKLATMTNNGLIGAGCEFVLGADIDLSGYSNWTPIGIYDALNNIDKPFLGTFDGNGHIVSNLTINSPTLGYVGLFGNVAYTGNIYNLGLENADVIGDTRTGSLIGAIHLGEIINCYATGQITGGNISGGLIGQGKSIIRDCYADVDVVARTAGGGLAGGWSSGGIIENCFALGDVSHSVTTSTGGGLVSWAYSPIKNCYSLGNAPNGLVFISDSTIENSFSHLDVVQSGKTPFVILNNAKVLLSNSMTDLQVGTNSDLNSIINIDMSFTLDGIKVMRGIGNGNGHYLEEIDFILEKVSEKQTEFGAVQNRLESVVEEIGIQYDNLVSSRSTLRDADMAELSSTYIQQQILQQAAATLMSTANQNPAIALQLI